MLVVPEGKRIANIGERFHRLVVLGAPLRIRKWRGSKCIASTQMVVAECDCGEIVFVNANHLRSQHTKSCGCIHREVVTTHGGRQTRLYTTWRAMRVRCSDENGDHAKYYARKGIAVCEAWGCFKIFREWATKSGYQNHLTIDRIDVDKGYYPENCRWADKETQANNKSCNIVASAFGDTKTLRQWSRDVRCVVSYLTLWQRVRIGHWALERALQTPSMA